MRTVPRRHPVRLALALIGLLLGLAVPGQAGMFKLKRSIVPGDNLFPENDEIPGLTRTVSPISYRGSNFTKYYGNASRVFTIYGIDQLIVGEYAYGDKTKRVTVEIARMDSPTAAAGIYHHHRAHTIGSARAKPMQVGAEVMLDAGREGRSLYFYRATNFVKVIYSGPEPVPDLLPIAQLVDDRLPKNRDASPDGFEYIKVPWVNVNSVQLTPGFTFNLSFLPPSVWAGAPGAGSPASDLYIITCKSAREAAGLVKDYASYLRFNAEYIEEYRKGNIRYTKAVDPNQGRVLFTSYQHVLIIAARPGGYEKGEELVEMVMARIDAAGPVQPQKGKR